MFNYAGNVLSIKMKGPDDVPFNRILNQVHIPFVRSRQSSIFVSCRSHIHQRRLSANMMR